jgi:hypothetical protein
MQENLTEIVLVLDRSGSMYATKDDAEGGLRKFVEEQKNVPGSARLTFYRFDDVVERVFEARDIHAVEEAELRLEPRNMTALLDAMGRAIDEVGKRLADADDGDRPSKVIFVTVTDGMENASRHFSKQGVFDRVARQRDVYKWEFVFVGANQDAIATAATLGVAPQAALSYAPTKRGTAAVYSSLSNNVAHVRTSGGPFAYTSEDRHSAADSN